MKLTVKRRKELRHVIHTDHALEAKLWSFLVLGSLLCLLLLLLLSERSTRDDWQLIGAVGDGGTWS